MVCSIEEPNNVTTIFVDELQSSLLVHEQHMPWKKEEDQALKMTSSGRTWGRGRGALRGGRDKGKQPHNEDLLGHIQLDHCQQRLISKMQLQVHKG